MDQDGEKYTTNVWNLLEEIATGCLVLLMSGATLIGNPIWNLSQVEGKEMEHFFQVSQKLYFYQVRV